MEWLSSRRKRERIFEEAVGDLRNMGVEFDANKGRDEDLSRIALHEKDIDEVLISSWQHWGHGGDTLVYGAIYGGGHLIDEFLTPGVMPCIIVTAETEYRHR